MTKQIFNSFSVGRRAELGGLQHLPTLKRNFQQPVPWDIIQVPPVKGMCTCLPDYM
jgi:hypothetical protein